MRGLEIATGESRASLDQSSASNVHHPIKQTTSDYPITSTAAESSVKDKGIDDLPNELLARTLSYLPLSALKNARLASKLWADTGARYLIIKNFCAPRPKAMEHFANIVEHPAFSKTVTTLVFDCRLLDPALLNRRIFEKVFRLVTRDLSMNPQSKSQQKPRSAAVSKSLSLYRKLWKAQDGLLETGGFRKTLQWGLLKMPKIENIILINNDMKHTCLPLVYHQCLDLLDEAFRESMFTHSARSPSSAFEYFFSRAGLDTSRHDMSVISIFMQSLKETRTSVRGLFMPCSIPFMPCSIPFILFGEPSFLDATSYTSNHLLTFRCETTVPIPIRTQQVGFTQEGTDRQQGIDYLVRFLSKMQLLQELTLDLRHKYITHDRVLAHLRLGGLNWPHLQSLELRFIKLATEDLMDLIFGCASNLRSLTLTNIQLPTAESWQCFFDIIPDRLRHLEFFHLDLDSLYPVEWKSLPPWDGFSYLELHKRFRQNVSGTRMLDETRPERYAVL